MVFVQSALPLGQLEAEGFTPRCGWVSFQQERVLDLQRQLLLLSERVRGKLAEHQRQQEEQRGVPVDRPPQRLDARSRQRVL